MLEVIIWWKRTRVWVLVWLVVSFTGAYGVGVSDVDRLKSLGDRTPHCGTPFLNWRCVDLLFLKVLYALRPLM